MSRGDSVLAGVRSLERAVHILRTLADMGSVARLGDVVNRTGLPKSTTHRLLEAMVELGLLDKDEHQRYQLGVGLVQLAGAALKSNAVTKHAHSVMRQLAELAQESVYLNVIYRDQRLVVDKVDDLDGIRHRVPVGELGPLHRGASGKVLLAFASESVQKRALEELLGSNTSKASLVEILREELSNIRVAGVAVSVSEVVSDVVAVACPVFDLRGDCVASLTVTGPRFRMTSERTEQVIQMCRESAAELSARLGYGISRPLGTKGRR